MGWGWHVKQNAHLVVGELNTFTSAAYIYK